MGQFNFQSRLTHQLKPGFVYNNCTDLYSLLNVTPGLFSLFFISVGMISSVATGWLAVRIGECVFPVKKCVLSVHYETSGKPLPSRLEEDFMDQTSKRNSKKSQFHAAFALLWSSNFSPFSFSPLFLLYISSKPVLCVCRASIVQKRVIFFQDQGSLTIRLCEKGNDSCPSSLPFCLLQLIFAT